MEKIKNKGLVSLIKEGELDFYGADIEVCACLTEDLSLEEITSTISVAEGFLPQMPSAIEKLKELEDRYNSLFFEVEEENEAKREATETSSSVKIILGVGSLIMGGILVLPKFIGLTSSAATTCMWWGLGCLAVGIVLLSLLPNQTKSNEQEEKVAHGQESEEQEEMRHLQTERDAICAKIGLCPTDTAWETPAENLSNRLPILISWLKKMKIIHEDNMLSQSAKMLALAQLFSLLNNEISNAKVLKEKQRQSMVMERQLKEMQKHSRELEAQNDMLTLQTYNKVSEMEGHDPNMVAAQTFAQMSRIQDKRKKED